MDRRLVVKTNEATTQEPPMTLAEEFRRKMGDLIVLSKEAESRLKKWLTKRLDEHEQDTAELKKKLIEDNDLIDGIVPETDFPWAGSCNTHIPIPEIYAKVEQGIYSRSLLGATAIGTAVTDDPNLMDIAPQVSEAVNYHVKNKWNVEEVAHGCLWAMERDSVGIMQIVWDECYETSHDVVLVDNLEEFGAYFPDPTVVGLDQVQYLDLFEKARMATPESPLEIPIEFEKQKYYGNKGEIVELYDFVIIPATAPAIEHDSCVGYGKFFNERRGVVKGKGKDGIYFKEAADKLVSKVKESKSSDFEEAKGSNEGIVRTGKGEVGNYELVIRYDLEKTGEEKKYLLTYNKDEDVLLSLRHYPYRIDFYAFFKNDGKPNRFLGRSVPSKTRDLSELIDAMFRQEVNSRSISHVPSFIGDSSKKKEITENNTSMAFYPGATKWVPGGIGGGAFDQMRVQPSSMNESAGDRAQLMNILDLLMGSAVSLQSGHASSSDPNAPGNKTAMMIGQANLRQEDPLSQVRVGIEQMLDICLSHLYQFGPPIISYVVDGQNGQQIKTLQKKFMREGLKFKMNGVTVTDNPEVEMEKWMRLHERLMQNMPEYAQNPVARVELVRMALKAGHVAKVDQITPTMQQLQQQMVEVQKQAMMQMMQEKAMAEQQGKQQMVKDNLAKAKQDIDIKETARKMAESRIPQETGAPNA